MLHLSANGIDGLRGNVKPVYRAHHRLPGVRQQPVHKEKREKKKCNNKYLNEICIKSCKTQAGLLRFRGERILEKSVFISEQSRGLTGIERSVNYTTHFSIWTLRSLLTITFGIMQAKYKYTHLHLQSLSNCYVHAVKDTEHAHEMHSSVGGKHFPSGTPSNLMYCMPHCAKNKMILFLTCSNIDHRIK